MKECPDEPAERPLSDRVREHDARGFRLIHEICEGEDRIPRHHPLFVSPPQRHLATDLAADDSRIGHSSGQRLSQEVRDNLLHLVPFHRISQVPRLVRTEVNPSGSDSTEQVRSLGTRALELGEELARRSKGGIVGRGAEAIHRLCGERTRFALARDLLGGLPDLEGEWRENGALRPLTDVRDAGEYTGWGREQGVRQERRRQKRCPAQRVEPDPLGDRPDHDPLERARQSSSRHQPF